MPGLKNFVSSILLAFGYSINSKSKKKLLGDLIHTFPRQNLKAPLLTDVTIRSLNRIETNQHGAIGRLEGGEVRHGGVPLITFVL